MTAAIRAPSVAYSYVEGEATTQKMLYGTNPTNGLFNSFSNR